MCFISLSEGVRGLWASLNTVQAHWERRASPQAAAVALGFKVCYPGAQALPACMAWVVESQAGLEPKATCTEASASSLVSGRLRCPLGSLEATVLHRGAAGSWQEHAQGELRDLSGVWSAWTSSHHRYWSCVPRNYRVRRRQLLPRTGLWGGLARSSVTALPGLTQL